MLSFIMHPVDVIVEPSRELPSVVAGVTNHHTAL